MNIKKIVEVGVNTVSDDLIDSLDEGIRKINEIIFFNEKVVGFFLDKLDCHTYLDDVSKWTELIENIINLKIINIRKLKSELLKYFMNIKVVMESEE